MPAYAGYDWPFPALPAPAFWLRAEWSLPQLLGYFSQLFRDRALS